MCGHWWTSQKCHNPTNAPQQRTSLENLVGTARQRQRNGDPERTGGFQVDVHLNFCCRLLHREIGRLITFKNLPGIESHEAMSVPNVGSVSNLRPRRTRDTSAARRVASSSFERNPGDMTTKHKHDNPSATPTRRRPARRRRRVEERSPRGRLSAAP